MRFNLNRPPKPNRRVRCAFLWFPRTIHGIRRWLERAEWEERLTGAGGWEDGYREFYASERWLDLPCDHRTPRKYREYHNGRFVSLCHCGKEIVDEAQ